MLELSPIIFWAAGSALAAFLGLLVARKVLTPIDLEKNGELLLAMVTIIGTLVSILLGLLVSSSVDDYHVLEASVDSEAIAIGSIFRYARGLPTEACASVEALCIEYCDAIVSKEWPAMSQERSSEELDTIAVRLNERIVGFKPTTGGEETLQASLLTELAHLGEWRGKRLVAVHSKWMRQLFPLLLMCVLILMAFCYLYLKRERDSFSVHATLVCFVAAALGTNVGVIVLLNRPFTGAWTIRPEGFTLAAEAMRKYQALPHIH